MKVLLHSCCGPCSCACVPRLKGEGHSVGMLFANSNIDTVEEFERRRENARIVAEAEGVEFASVEYDHEDWLRTVAAGHEGDAEKGERCERCFRYSLRKAAEFAAQNGYDAFTTSLSVSPHKISRQLFAAGRDAASCGVPFLEEDFKKCDGCKESVRRSEELGLYRQSYCGCEFSKRGRR